MRFRLCAEDRKHFGTKEWLEFSPRNISVNDMEELSGRFGFDPADWPEPFLGQLTLEQAGDPNARPKPPRWRDRALAWMLLRQNGYDVSWEDAGNVHMLLIESDTDVAPPPGKDPPEASPSPTSAASTTRRSATSTRSRKKPSTA